MAPKKIRISPKTGNKLPVLPHQKFLQKALHDSADFFEASLRARVYKELKKLQAKTSINSLTLALANHRSVHDVISRKMIEAAVRTATEKVVRDAFLRGGKLGAEHVKDLPRG
jgi:hypothetical protein